MTTRIVELRRGILKKNDELAAGLRARYGAAGVLVLNLVSSPGHRQDGLSRVHPARTAGAGRKGGRAGGRPGNRQRRAPTRRERRARPPDQHPRDLSPRRGDDRQAPGRMGRRHQRKRFLAAGLDYLFIENVGNLVCPSSYDLGEKIRVALLSVTEGEDKPLKYPTLFNSADAAVITKMDIAEPCGFNRELALKNINEIRPGIRIFETSAKTGVGMPEWLSYLAEARGVKSSL